MHNEFSDHVSSTFEGKDVSSMEQIYRWVAGGHMIAVTMTVSRLWAKWICTQLQGVHSVYLQSYGYHMITLNNLPYTIIICYKL